MKSFFLILPLSGMNTRINTQAMCSQNNLKYHLHTVELTNQWIYGADFVR